jgi:hypothetical protein
MGPKPSRVRLRTSTTELLARAFADAVAADDLEAAEGWLAVASLVAGRVDRRALGDPSGGSPAARS